MISLDGLLADKIAIVTGASSGIGAVAAPVFAKAGATVVLAARDTQAMTAAAQEIADDSPVGDFASTTSIAACASTWAAASSSRSASGTAGCRPRLPLVV